MKYMLMIFQGTTPTPLDPDAWAALSEDEQRSIYAAYKTLNETPGVTPGSGLQPPETATTVRVQDGKTITSDGPFVETKEALNGYLIYEAADLDAAIELAASIPAARLGRSHRGAPDHGVGVGDPRADLPGRVGSGRRDADRPPRRLRPRRGGRPGGVHGRRGALAA